jgi:DeoR family glycerol-3-phosphate regulon repressor
MSDAETADRKDERQADAGTERAAAGLTERQGRILALAERQGFVTIESLADDFGVSAQTVRRDIIALDRAGLLQRFHGGAGSNGQSESLRLDHERKRALNVEAKRVIADKAAALVPDGSAIFLDVGTTVEAAAVALNRKAGLLVFTNSLLSALCFDHARHEVHVIGGRLSGKDGSLTGETAVAVLAGLRLDVALIGCSAIEDGGRIMDFDIGKIAVKRAAMRAAGRSLLLATRSKFGRTARAEVATREAFSEIVTE